MTWLQYFLKRLGRPWPCRKGGNCWILSQSLFWVTLWWPTAPTAANCPDQSACQIRYQSSPCWRSIRVQGCLSSLDELLLLGWKRGKCETACTLLNKHGRKKKRHLSGEVRKLPITFLLSLLVLKTKMVFLIILDGSSQARLGFLEGGGVVPAWALGMVTS